MRHARPLSGFAGLGVLPDNTTPRCARPGMPVGFTTLIQRRGVTAWRGRCCSGDAGGVGPPERASTDGEPDSCDKLLNPSYLIGPMERFIGRRPMLICPGARAVFCALIGIEKHVPIDHQNRPHHRAFVYSS